MEGEALYAKILPSPVNKNKNLFHSLWILFKRNLHLKIVISFYLHTIADTKQYRSIDTDH